MADAALARAVPAELAAVATYVRANRAPNTERAYRGEWAAFVAWCAARGAEALPAAPVVVATYLATLADGGRKPAGIALALAALSHAHHAAGLPSPRDDRAVRDTMKGIRRTLGTAQRRVAPLTVLQLRAMVAACPASLVGARDAAALLVGFAGALRRSELVALDVRDVRFVDQGAEVTVRRAKTDQEGAGRVVGLPFGADPITCPVRALRRYLTASGLTEGALFRPVSRGGALRPQRLTGHAVAALVKRYAAPLGLEVSELSGHSLRAGLATAAALAGKSERAIMRQTGHASAAMVRRYIRAAETWTENAAEGVGL